MVLPLNKKDQIRDLIKKSVKNEKILFLWKTYNWKRIQSGMTYSPWVKIIKI